VTHTVVKVCGLTRLEDARDALAAGADWLGFIVAAGGPREIGAERMAAIVESVPGAVGVAVMARVDPATALALGRRAGARRLQLHQVDPSDWPADFPIPCAFVASVDGDGRLHGTLASPPHLIQLDTADPTRTGGTGRTFPWEHARRLVGGRPFVLAGGLGPDNVASAIRIASPFGVDAASRLEISPGIKDPARVRAFVAAVRAADSGAGG
jgi:phosphoribosylanthranilate isomerase